MRSTLKTSVAAAVTALALLFACEAAAQDPGGDQSFYSRRGGPARSVGPVTFSVDTGVFYSEDGSPLVEVYLEAPYDELPFVRKSGGYVSHVEVVAVFRNRSGDQVGGDSWSRDVWVKDYDETIDPDNTYRATAKFAIPPGEYDLKLTCGGGGSDFMGEAYKRFEVPAPPEEGLLLSDIRLGFCAPDDSTKTAVSSGFVPSGARSFGVETPVVCAIIAAYALAGVEAESLAVEASAVDEDGRTAWAESLWVARAGRETTLHFGVPMDSLAWGAYILSLDVRAGEHRAQVRRGFEVDETRVGVAMDLDLFIELMSLVATEEELETFASLGGSERRAYLDGIWKRRDPDPSTPRNEFKVQFFRRLKYAKENFAEPGRKGWQTDRGRVFIKNGRPDRIDTRQGVIGSMSPDARLEVWYYDATNTHYVFEDFGGNGEYTLVDVVQG
jgi:GWxTD domain-containing protein